MLGGSDFYEYLETYPWYYSGKSWDKLRTVEILSTLRAERFVDIGSGEGLLLELAAARGVNGFGIEMNQTAVSNGCAAGRRIYSVNDPALQNEHADVLVTLQTLEHVNDPRAWLRASLERFDTRYAVVAVPCHDTTLGKTSDPLAWPPHHATLWSGKALRVLAKQVGYRVIKLEYEPNSWRRFDKLLDREPEKRRLGRLPRFPEGRTGLNLFRILRRLNVPWVTNAHTALALMERA
jgi:SAM-dependent methyltransferase